MNLDFVTALSYGISSIVNTRFVFIKFVNNLFITKYTVPFSYRSNSIPKMKLAMNDITAFSLISIFALMSNNDVRRVGAFRTMINISTRVPLPSTSSSHVLSMGLIDDWKLIFSEEGKANKAAYEARERAEQEAAQREILERRRNPEKMEEYEQQVNEGRVKLQEEKDVWDFQGKIEDGYDPLTEWTRLKDEGLITTGNDLERDKGSERLGSEGLIDVRIDERLPYIDQGYVDEGADLMGGIMNLFGGNKEKVDKKDDNEEEQDSN